jgi:putative holliday junction resolvase
MKYIGVDYGNVKIGIALSDENGTMGFPHSIIGNDNKTIENVCSLAAKEDARAIVIGNSLDYEWKENPIAKDAKRFGDEITVRCGVPIFYEWEGLTSAEARRMPSKRIKSREAPSRTRSDASAAALILTSYLDRQRSSVANIS